MRLAGGRVRGTRNDKQRPAAELLAATVQPTAGAEQARFTPPPANGSPGGAANSPRGGGEYDDLWPLQLVNPQDDEQLGVLYALLHRLPHAVQHYLEQLVFPLTMQHQLLKLSANGQDLGSKALFGCRLGFSGTPSDLLPKDFGRAQYQRGDDAMMIATLTNPAVVQYTFTSEQWTVGGLLDEVAAARPPYHTLIDAGALITGLTNLQVARYLLQHGLPSMDGVVFLDEADRKMILLRAGLKVLPLAGCGVSPQRRFTFFDQVHALGVDVEQTLSARAAMTIGKDMTFRDFAQGAFRMRAVGRGQTITLLLTPQVSHLVRVEVARLQRRPTSEQKGLRDASHEQALKVVCAWLLVNLMRTEDVQAGLLAEQRLAHVFRQRALEHLLAHHRRCGAADARDHERRALSIFMEPMAHHVAADVPEPPRGGEKALDMAARHEGFLRASIPGTDGAASEEAMHAMRSLRDELLRLHGGGVATAELIPGLTSAASLVLEVEQVQEQEAEAEAEEEQEQEQEQEQEKNQEQEVEAIQEPARHSWSREDEGTRPWSLDVLGAPPQPDGARSSRGGFGGSTAPPFYPWSQFAVYRSGMKSLAPLSWPAHLWMSANYFKAAWSLKSHRRLKNVVCCMEWAPPNYEGVAGGAPAAAHAPLTDAQRKRVRAAFGFFDADHDEMLTAAELAALGRAVDLETVAQDAGAAEQDVPAGGPELVEALVTEQLRSHREGPGANHPGAPGARFWVVLSLQEAESLRGALHIAHGADGAASGALVALHTDGEVLDSLNYAPGSSYERAVVEQSLRLLSAESEYSPRAQQLLLRCLQPNEAKHRQAFFTEVRACRRRIQAPWENTDVKAVLTEADEFSLFEHRALLAAAQRRLRATGLSLRMAFHAFNSSRTGLLSASELYSGFVWLGVRPSVDHVHAVIRRLDADGDGLLSSDDFVAGIAACVPSADVSAVGAAQRGQELFIPLTTIPELHDHGRAHALLSEGRRPASRTPTLSAQELLEFAAALRPAALKAEMSIVVREYGPLNVWALAPPERSNRTTLPLPLGHYAVDGKGGYELEILELRDAKPSSFRMDASLRLQAAANQRLPPPVRFVRLWSARGAPPMTVWAPVPPSAEFVAIGHVVTTSQEQPPAHCMRCVPRAWARPARPEQVWVGMDGGVWRNRHGLLIGAKGQQPPQAFELADSLAL